MIKKEIFSNGVFIIFIVDFGARIHFANLVRGARFNGETTITTSMITPTTIMTSSTINLAVEATVLMETTTVLTAIKRGEEEESDWLPSWC